MYRRERSRESQFHIPEAVIATASQTAGKTTTDKPVAASLPKFELEDLVQSVERLFERENEEDPGVMVHGDHSAAEALPDDADLVYVDAAGDLHLIHVTTSFDEAFFDLRRGLHALTGAESDFAWVALPYDDFRTGNKLFDGKIEDICKRRGVGVIGISRCGRGLSARFYVESRRAGRGDLAEYNELEQLWRGRRNASVIAGTKPGEYYVVADEYKY